MGSHDNANREREPTVKPKYPRKESERKCFRVVKKTGKVGTRLVTPFQFRVYDATLAIPEGQVSTYGEIAKKIGSHARAVGQALRHNPFAPEVPCHRVVAATGFIAGFNGQWGAGALIDEKKALLRKEGVSFDKDSVLIKKK